MSTMIAAARVGDLLRTVPGQLLLGTVPALAYAVLLHRFLDDVGHRYPFFCFVPVILGAARFGGLLAGLAATASAAILLDRIWLSHDVSIVTVSAGTTTIAEAMFLLFGVLITVAHSQLYAREQELKAALARERAAADREAEANKTKDDFLATLSHELRTPMNVVLGYAHLLKKAVGTCTCVRREQVDMMLATLDRNGRAQMRLVEDLLDVQRIVAGKFELEYSEFDLQGLSVAVIDSLRPQASAKNLQWAVTIQPLRMRGDAARVQQVLWNLLANAIKFTPDGGSVRMHAARRDGKVVIHVQDSGQGIPAHFLPHGFERFRQLDSSSTRRHYGMGLGLAIVKEVVTRHGGEVTAESPGEGRGSTFVVTLPADHQPPHAQA